MRLNKNDYMSKILFIYMENYIPATNALQYTYFVSHLSPIFSC